MSYMRNINGKLLIIVVTMVATISMECHRIYPRRPLFVGKRGLGRQHFCQEDYTCPMGYCCASIEHGVGVCSRTRKLGDICAINDHKSQIVSELSSPNCACDSGLECARILGADFGFCLPLSVMGG